LPQPNEQTQNPIIEFSPFQSSTLGNQHIIVYLTCFKQITKVFFQDNRFLSHFGHSSILKQSLFLLEKIVQNLIGNIQRFLKSLKTLSSNINPSLIVLLYNSFSLRFAFAIHPSHNILDIREFKLGP
jgi:hypothetical protein